LERHRLIFLYLQTRGRLFDYKEKRMLHIAPERQMAALFQSADYIEYLSGDLSGRAMMTMDITALPLPDDSFDVIYCSHVLEHVPADRQAMAEFYRVLKPGGWALLLVPISAEHTIEDLSVTSPEERERLYGQRDHVRRYGPDYVDRLRSAGFTVKVEPFAREMSRDDVQRFGLMEHEDIYLCEKHAS
jgi:SAM-dependent methyltransferase